MNEFSKNEFNGYELIGKVVVRSEELNFLMNLTCKEALIKEGLPDICCETILSGNAIEASRRLFVSLLLQYYENEESKSVILNIDRKVDAANRKRNKLVHSFWNTMAGRDKDGTIYWMGSQNTKNYKDGGTTLKTSFMDDFSKLDGEFVEVITLVSSVCTITKYSNKKYNLKSDPQIRGLL